jgi:hypothetical protein
LTYIPSKKDRREELYEVLNKTTQRKAAAVEKLRRAAVSAARANPSGSSSAMTTRSGGQSAVKSGFLNKKKEPSRLAAFYEKHLGPNSLVQQLAPIAKNYVLFFGFATFMHFKGQMFSLPPPV